MAFTGAHYIVKLAPGTGEWLPHPPVPQIKDRENGYRQHVSRLYRDILTGYRTSLAGHRAFLAAHRAFFCELQAYSMPISWYPGHMRKARKELGTLLRRATLVIEVLDARIPAASCNPLLAEMRGATPLVRILNKSDLADAAMTGNWQKHFAGDFAGACLINGRDFPLPAPAVLEQASRVGGGSGSDFPRRGRIAITGIPNVGKSSLLNQLIGRKLAATGNTPAVTRRQQAAGFAEKWVLVDTPGMLRPRLEDQAAALLMASVGSIGAAAANKTEVGYFLAELLLAEQRPGLARRYGLAASDNTAEALFDRIAIVRGARGKGGGLDLERAAHILLQDFRGARLGRITLETPSGQIHRSVSTT